MLLVGLTGGIGSGKSTVGRMLQQRGAILFDADVLARDAVAPGTPGHEAVLDRFGARTLDVDGSVDRTALAALVFTDPQARRDLEAIVHPEVFRLLAERIDPYRSTNQVVVFDAPLIVETGFHEACDVVILVSAPEATRIQRLMLYRGMLHADAEARLASQASEAERERIAHITIRNEGGLEDLEREVEAVWEDLRARADAKPPSA